MAFDFPHVINVYLFICIPDLFEIGRTTGQTVRRMFIPSWKQEGEEEGEGDDGKNSVASQKANNSGSDAKGDKSKNLKVKGEDGKSPRAKEKDEKNEGQAAESVTRKTSKEWLTGGEDLINRHWFNYVCYGLPNLMVTQV